jgi:hypothetical protein
MTRAELHAEIAKYLYIEDFGMVDIIVASIVANSMKAGDPVWLTLIGPSSGGKSQIIRPFAQAHSKLIHQIDDLTPNTLISGTQGLEGSLLGRIGAHGIVSMDDLTVLFSKNSEQRAEILSQFRMMYDGRFSKSSGNRKEAMVWNGYIGMIAGSTPSIYRYFSEVADMGERFISYRMKKYDTHKAVEFVTKSGLSSKEMTDRIADALRTYLLELLPTIPESTAELPPLHDETKQAIQTIAEHSTLLRTPVHVDERSGLVDEFPEPEMPFRVMKQLTALARALQVMAEIPTAPLPEDMTRALEWTGYSLCNDKRRAWLRNLVGLKDAGKMLTARNLSTCTGLHTEVVKKELDQLQAIGIIRLLDEDGGHKKWEIANKSMADLTRRIDPYDTEVISEVYDDAL